MSYLRNFPMYYRRKVADKKPVAADLARLLWIAQCLQEDRADVVAWLDADFFIFAPANLQGERAAILCIWARILVASATARRGISGPQKRPQCLLCISPRVPDPALSYSRYSTTGASC